MPIESVFAPSNILLPACADMSKWATIACDQFSSEPEYWERVKNYVGDCPSTLNMIIPEAWLDSSDTHKASDEINAAMVKYLGNSLFKDVENSYVFTQRELPGGKNRLGLVGVIDLDSYEYTPGSCAYVRASERTVVDRLPPRIYAREHAELELPHVMVLIDDPDMSVIEPLTEKIDKMERLYDFDLMEGGGRISGYRVTEEYHDDIRQCLEKLSNPDLNFKKYGAGTNPVLMIVGDGNHSLAAAKICWEEVKKGLNATRMENHPARFALVELCNIHDTSLEIEPIHRVVFTSNIQKLIEEFTIMADEHKGKGETYEAEYVYDGNNGKFLINSLNISEFIDVVQTFIDKYAERESCHVDYIHGSDTLERLISGGGALGLYMPAISKGDLFKSVAQGRVFPKKSFSMGHARDKRYYLEARRIK